MQHADLLTVIHHDDTTRDFTDVRYTITRAGLRVRSTDDTETLIDTHDVLTTHAHTHHRPEDPR